MSKIHYRTQYWLDAFEAACEEAGIWDVFNNLSDDKKLAAAEVIQGGAENQDLAFGPTPSDPREDEISRLKREHKAELERQGRRFDVLLNEACRVARVDPNRVSVSETELLVYPR